MNKNLLVGIMKSNGDTQAALAKKIGISPQTFNAKLNEKNRSEFHRDEIKQIKDEYHLDGNTISAIFFDDEVS